jgi:hypothetical protein
MIFLVFLQPTFLWIYWLGIVYAANSAAPHRRVRGCGENGLALPIRSRSQALAQIVRVHDRHELDCCVEIQKERSAGWGTFLKYSR